MHSNGKSFHDFNSVLSGHSVDEVIATKPMAYIDVDEKDIN
jgi:hypothetical protein